jgi:hypothetical protein
MEAATTDIPEAPTWRGQSSLPRLESFVSAFFL